jgi:HEAT repeat protein
LVSAIVAQLRSWAVDDLVVYLAELETLFAETPLLGQRLDDDLWIELKATGRDRLEKPPAPLDTLVSRLGRAAILGGPGSGKSEWLRRLARAAAREARKTLEARLALPDAVVMPIFLPLARIADALAKDKDEALCRVVGKLRGDMPDMLSPSERIAAAVLVALRGTYEAVWSPRLDQILWTKLMPQAEPGQAQALLCLDGWDETSASQKDDLRTGLRTLFEMPDLRVRMTSRPGSYEPMDAVLFGRHQEFEIKSFMPDDIRRFIERFFKTEPGRAAGLLADLRDKPRIAGFAENPLQATLLCLIYEDGGSLPLRSVELYHRALDKLMTVWLQRNRPQAFGHERNSWLRHERGRRSMLKLLQAIAERVFPATTIRSGALYDLLVGTDRSEGYLSGLPVGDPALPWIIALGGAQAAGDALCDLGLMTRSGDDYAFLHTTIQEYLVAAAKARRANGSGWSAIAEEIDSRAWDPAWQEAVILMAGLLEDPRPLIELLADPERDDIAHHRTILAALALPELNPKWRGRLASLIDRITDIVVANARDELGSPRVLDITHFTPALPALLEVNGCYDATPFRDWLARHMMELLESSETHLFWACGASAATPEILASLLRALRDPDDGVRSSAMHALGGIGPAAATTDVLNELMRLLGDCNEVDTVQALETLGRLGRAAASRDLLVPLTRMLNDPNRGLRFLGIDTIGQIGPAAATPEVIAALTCLLKDPDAALRRQAVSALDKLRPVAVTPEVLAVLTHSLDDADQAIKVSSADALGKLGPAAATPEVLTALTRALGDSDVFVRSSAASVLGEIGLAATPQTLLADVITGLTHALNDPEGSVRAYAASALGAIGPAAATSEVLAALMHTLNDPDEFVRMSTASALGKIEPAKAARDLYADVLAALMGALNDPDDGVKCTAAHAIGQIGQMAATPEVLAALIGASNDDDEWVRYEAALGLGAIGPRTATLDLLVDVLAALMRALSDSEEFVRGGAAYALGAIGPTAATQETLGALRHVVQQHDGVIMSGALAACIGSFRVFDREPQWVAITLEDLASGRHRPSLLPRVSVH